MYCCCYYHCWSIHVIKNKAIFHCWNEILPSQVDHSLSLSLSAFNFIHSILFTFSASITLYYNTVNCFSYFWFVFIHLLKVSLFFIVFFNFQLQYPMTFSWINCVSSFFFTHKIVVTFHTRSNCRLVDSSKT